MLARTLALVLALSSTGCATYMVQMKLSDEDAGPDYVIMRTRGNTERVFDCMSRPNGTDWDPTCVKVKFQSAAGSTDK